MAILLLALVTSCAPGTEGACTPSCFVDMNADRLNGVCAKVAVSSCMLVAYGVIVCLSFGGGGGVRGGGLGDSASLGLLPVLLLPSCCVPSPCAALLQHPHPLSLISAMPLQRGCRLTFPQWT